MRRGLIIIALGITLGFLVEDHKFSGKHNENWVDTLHAEVNTFTINLRSMPLPTKPVGSTVTEMLERQQQSTFLSKERED